MGFIFSALFGRISFAISFACFLLGIGEWVPRAIHQANSQGFKKAELVVTDCYFQKGRGKRDRPKWKIKGLIDGEKSLGTSSKHLCGKSTKIALGKTFRIYFNDDLRDFSFNGENLKIAEEKRFLSNGKWLTLNLLWNAPLLLWIGFYLKVKFF